MLVWLIGAGPGDPGLFTLRGQELLAQADTVVYDALANPELLRLARKDAELIYVGKVAGRHALPQEEINALLVQKAHEGRRVARLKGGDPYIFGRGGEEAEALLAAGVPFEEVPGISSAVAAPAYAGIPLTHRDFCSSLCILTGHEKPGREQSAHNWQALASSGSTLVFVMGMQNLADIAAKLLANGMSPAMPAAVIERGTTPLQRCVRAPLCDIAQRAQEQGLRNPAVIVIGKVAALHERLDWFGARPLLGRRIVVTRSREQASGMVRALSALGACVIECPSIRIEPLDNPGLESALAKLQAYQWLIFTSANGVEHFWQALDRGGQDSRALFGLKLCAIGPGTAQALAKHGLRADLVPQKFVAEALAEALIGHGSLKGVRILLARAQDAREVLPEILRKEGAEVDILPLYRSIPDSANREEILQLLKQDALDCISFASSSTVRNFLALVSPELLRANPCVKLAAIGPITAQTLKEYGLEAEIEPQDYTIPALVQAIADYFQQDASQCR